MVDSVRKSGEKKSRKTDGSTSSREKLDYMYAEVGDDSTPQQGEQAQDAKEQRVIKRKKKKKPKKKDNANKSSSSSSSDPASFSDSSRGPVDTSAKAKSAPNLGAENEGFRRHSPNST